MIWSPLGISIQIEHDVALEYQSLQRHKMDDNVVHFTLNKFVLN